MIEYHIQDIRELNPEKWQRLGQENWQLITIFEGIAYFSHSVPVINLNASSEKVSFKWPKDIPTRIDAIGKPLD